MSILTLGSHITKAIDFYNKTEMHFAIGRTSPWSDENNPPIEDASTTQIDQIIGYKKVETKYFVVPDPLGTINYKDTNWRILSDSSESAVRTALCYWVYVSAVIYYDELPLTSYRQAGLYTNLVRATGISGSKTALLPSEVQNSGILCMYANFKSTNRSLTQQDKFNVVLEF